METSRIGSVDRRNLFAAGLAAAERFYADPANMEKFERWLRERQRQNR